ncbi:MAG: CoA pyrophosphatase, partial [Bacteroidota bacterium]
LMQPRMLSGAPIQLKHKQAPRAGAVLILVYEDQDRLRFPLIQRPTYQGVHSGQMGLPGGKAEPEDHSLYATAMREAQEEIGVDPSTVEVIGSLSSFYVAASNYQVLPVLGVTDRTPQFVPDRHEVEEVVVGNLHHLMDTDYVKEKEIVAAAGFRLQSPYFELEGKTVWGATAMMLSEFSFILKEIYGHL